MGRGKDSGLSGLKGVLIGMLLVLATACASSPPGTATVGGLAVPDTISSVQSGDMRIGPLDILEMRVFGVPDLNGSYQVDPSGQLKIPLIGQVDARGRTTFELAASIERSLAERFVKNPQVSIRVEQAFNEQLTVEGAVGRPGMYPVTGSMTLLRAIALSGGLSEAADKRRVIIFRQIDGQRKAGAFDLKGIRSGALPDPPVYGNDVIVVDGSGARQTYQEVLRSLPLIGLFVAVF
jgi:polysaccharide export outer membrane protein